MTTMFAMMTKTFVILFLSLTTLQYGSSHASSLLLVSKLVRSIPRGGSSIVNDPYVVYPPIWAPTGSSVRRGWILMDRFSEYHGVYLEQMALEVYGVAVIRVSSDYIRRYLMEAYDEHVPSLPQNPTEWKEWRDKIAVDRIEGIICESDAGLAEAEQLAVQLKVSKHNGILEARRNKYWMNDKIQSKAGLPVVRQKLCTTLHEAIEFARELHITDEESSESMINNEGTVKQRQQQQRPGLGLLGTGCNSPQYERPVCIVKPMRGVGSDSVYLCPTLSNVQHAFQAIHGTALFGSTTERQMAVLVQEFAEGTEYAIDIISKDGQHKVAALWRYDKRPTNGRAFVYYATELISTTTRTTTKQDDSSNALLGEEVDEICDYAIRALNALDWKWGMTHTEIIQTNEGCRLVEVNCRQHNMDFMPITNACIGYNAMDMLLASYLGDCPVVPGKEDMCLEWNLLPDRPVLRAHGAMVHFVNYAHGTLVGINEDALREIQNMESVWDLQVYNPFLEIGNVISPTVDIKSDAGWAQLINQDAEAFLRDYNRIVDLMPTLFYVQ
jgi:ATP-grasp domain